LRVATARCIRTLVIAASMASALGITGQTHPNVERGFAADKMYQFGDVDHVNLFNGNLTLTIPMGGSAPVSDRLSLSLTLVHNGKLWTATPRPYANGGQEPISMLVYSPDRRDNAGFGWMISPGRLIDPSETDINNEAGQFIYLSPDGSDRLFYETLHAGSEQAEGGVLYSRDGTYLRLSLGGAGRILESPDGTIREFASYSDGIYTRWQLTKIRDRFGNYIDLYYSTPDQWRIVDQFGRTTIVHFASRASDVDAEYRKVVSSIDVPAVTIGGTATYQLVYQDKWVLTGNCTDAHPDTPVGYKLPLLSSVSLPDGSSYAFSYTPTTADSEEQLLPPAMESCLSGGLTSVTLPTLGMISYTYQEYALPVSPCGLDAVAISSGIRTRVLTDPLNAGNDQTWTYETNPSVAPGEHPVTCPGGTHMDPGASEFTNTVTVSTSTEPVAQATRYYFSVWHTNNRADSVGTVASDYGLPFSKLHAFDGRFLSTEILSAGGTPLRSTYLTYERDYSAAAPDQFNSRVKGSRTVFLDDDELTANFLHRHYVDTAFEEFDGVGHYRKQTISGDLRGPTRTVTTAYNTVDPLVNPGALVTGTYDGSSSGGTFVRPSLIAPWVLNLYPTVTTNDLPPPGIALTAVQEVCFDPSTGFVKGARTRAGAGRGATDLIAVFGSDPARAGYSVGAVTSEQYYGGDVFPLTVDPLPPASPSSVLCDVVTGTPGTLGYDIRHSYSGGVRVSSEYFSGNASVGFKFLDQDIDIFTGLTMHARDTSLVDTEYTYDSLRRVLSAKSGDDPMINYRYPIATGSTGAHVSIWQTSANSGTPQAGFDFDGFGRLVLQSRSLPSVTPGIPRWTRQKTVYDAMGRKSTVSEWEESISPSHVTTFSGFDMFGRATTITKPDNSRTFLGYHGVRQIDRTSSVHTGAGVESSATTTEIYDLLGRLYQVVEPNQNTTTTYTYDIGGRLQTVSMNDGVLLQPQSRSFTYDNRGFLRSEHHPELGTPDNPTAGTTDYSQYDARGHSKSKTTGVANGVNDLRLSYDPSERLTDVYDNGGARLLKHFDFATANVGTNKQQGKLAQAVRVNNLPAGDVVVTEKYTYNGTSGRTSARETLVTSGSQTLQDYQQAFEYDDLGSVKSPGYPTCPSCGNPPPGATFTYKDGSLVSIPGYAQSLTYSGNMLSSVVHQGGFTDTYNQDPLNGLPRPSSISFAVATCSVPAAPVITAATSVPANSTGNVATVTDGSLTYNWTVSNGSKTATTPTSMTYTAGASGTVSISVTATNSCGVSPPGTRNVAITAAPTLYPPTNFSATTTDYSSVVRLTWQPGQSGSTSYRIERKDCYSCLWHSIGSVTDLWYYDTVAESSIPVPYLYHVIAVATGSSDSDPSAQDYAVTAATLFAEDVLPGTRIRGSHIQELRRAIDELRVLAGLPRYWTNYNAPTGKVLASHQIEMRTALDAAVWALKTQHVPFAGSTPAPRVRILATHINQLRAAVR
jgi:YD repeat-containing protein